MSDLDWWGVAFLAWALVAGLMWMVVAGGKRREWPDEENDDRDRWSG